MPDKGTIPAARSWAITVQTDAGTLEPGVYNGQVALQVEDTTRTVRVLLVMAPGPPSAGARAAGGCSRGGNVRAAKITAGTPGDRTGAR